MSANQKDEFVPWRELLNKQYGASLMLVCLGVWLHAADSLIVATMLPSMIDDIGGVALVSWTVSLYQMGSIVAGASSAILTMRYGLRRPMVAAVLLFGLGCSVSAVAPNMWVVLIGRLMQGIGGGGLVAMSFVAVSIIFPRRLIARALAAVSTLWGVSAFLGPLIGGFFVEYANWRMGFWFFTVQAFLLAGWIVFAAKISEKRFDDTAGTVPVLRLLLLSAGIVLIAYGGTHIAPLRTSLLIVAGLMCLLLFLKIEAGQGANRLLPAGPFDVRRPAGAALLMILVLSMGTIALTAYGPLLLTLIYNASALTAGYMIACSSIGWTMMAVSVSGSPEKHDGTFIACGMLTVAISIIGFVYSVPNGPFWMIAVFAALQGGGFGMSWTFILRRTTALAQPHEMHRISAAMPTIQRLGYALGAAYVGIVANAVGIENNMSAIDSAQAAKVIFLSSLPFAVVGLFAMSRLVRHS